jgi:hypothetical protein
MTKDLNFNNFHLVNWYPYLYLLSKIQKLNIPP